MANANLLKNLLWPGWGEHAPTAVPSQPTVPAAAKPTTLTAPPAPQPKQEHTNMAFLSFLSKAGQDVVGVFTWLGSPRGQAVIKTGEAVLVAVDPALTGVVNLAQSWITKAIETEALAAAAAHQNGSSVQKASAVMAAMGPEIKLYFPAATAAEVSLANDSIIKFLNAFSVPATGTTAAAPATAAPVAAGTAAGWTQPAVG